MKTLALIVFLALLAGCACTPIPPNSTAEVTATYQLVRQVESLYWLILVIGLLIAGR